jgi:hypothetical protein
MEFLPINECEITGPEFTPRARQRQEIPTPEVRGLRIANQNFMIVKGRSGFQPDSDAEPNVRSGQPANALGHEQIVL